MKTLRKMISHILKKCHRAKNGDLAPDMIGHAVLPGFDDLKSKYPELAAQWHPMKNGNLKPDQVSANSSKLVWWRFPYDDPTTGEHFVYEWMSSVRTRVRCGAGCPYMTRRK